MPAVQRAHRAQSAASCDPTAVRIVAGKVESYCGQYDDAHPPALSGDESALRAACSSTPKPSIHTRAASMVVFKRLLSFEGRGSECLTSGACEREAFESFS